MGNTFSSNSRIEKKTELDISKKDEYIDHEQQKFKKNVRKGIL